MTLFLLFETTIAKARHRALNGTGMSRHSNTWVDNNALRHPGQAICQVIFLNFWISYPGDLTRAGSYAIAISWDAGQGRYRANID
ncbi:MAG: hypothetical protein R3293_14665 [Candidatus Promineifilaceae bacterium]|nr:hypothetical protein [Candidatus Promineifilaceae bacterium]